MNGNYEIDFTTLNWVKQELEDTLKQARQSLESYVDDPQDASLMRFCASYLHQVQGTLRMVELYGAAMVVEEMERLAQSLLDGKVRQTEEAYQILMRGMLQVPDYLDRLQSGHRDIPIVLLPLLNDLRACRGEKLLTETALFSPDLSRSLPASVSGPAKAVPDPVLKANGARLRMAFQLGLLKWFKGEEVSANTARLSLILERLQSATTQLDARRLWWVGAGLLDAIRAEKVDSSVSVKLLVGRVDRELKNLVDHGEGWFARQAPLELTKNLLYYLAQVEGAGDRVDAIRELYGLGELLPSSEELEHARGVMSGANRQLLDTVGDAIKEDVLRVKDSLDLFLRTGNGEAAELEPQREALQRVADTLGMLGLGVPRRLVLDQKETVDAIVAGNRPPDENTLLDIAGALLYVESSLDDHIAHLGRDSGAARSAGEAGLELPQAEVRQILEATMKEAQANVQQAKQDIVAFIESPWDHSKIEDLPRLLEEITGALRMLNLPDAAALLHAVTRFIDMELLKYRRVPSGEQLDLLADALASIEYYMEALRDQRGNRERILEVTQRSLEALGYWPLPEMLPEGESAEVVEQAAPEHGDLPSFGGDFMATTPAEATLELSSSDELPSIDLPPVEPLRIEPVEEEAAKDESAEQLALRTAVEIAPGEGLEALVVGEANAEPSGPAETELHGLRFDQADTEAVDREAQVEATLLEAADEAAPAGVDLSLDFPPPETEGEAVTAEAGEPAEDERVEPELRWELDEDRTRAEAEVEATTEPSEAASEEAQPDADMAIEAEPVQFESLEPLAIEEAAPASEPTEAPDGAKWYEASVEELVEEGSFDEATAEAEVGDTSEQGAHDTLAAELAAQPMELTELSLTSDFQLEVETPAIEQALAPEVAPPAVAPTQAPAPPALEVPDSSFQAVPSDEIDEEIREVFVEEVQDELENLNRQYPAWAADQADQEKLKPVRRSFHTLKGSGRLVGALAIGEFSWKIENMLNRVLDKTIPVTPALLDLMDKSIAALPELLAALRGEGPPTTNIGAIMWCADRLAAGEEVWLPKAEPAPHADDLVAAAPEAGTQSGAEESAEDTSESQQVSETQSGESGEEPAQAVLEMADAGSESTPSEATVSLSPLDVDPVLMEILRSEVTAHLQSVRDYLGEWYSQGEPMMASEELLRAVHTLNGAVSMVDLPAIANLVAPLEGYLKRARGHDLPVERRAADLLSEASDAIDDCMERLEAGEPLPDLGELIEAAIALRDGLPVVERGYQAFGIHMADESGVDETVAEVGAEPVAESLEAQPVAEAPAEAGSERPWYEADLGEEAVAVLDELGLDEPVQPSAPSSGTEWVAERPSIEEDRADQALPWYEAELTDEEGTAESESIADSAEPEASGDDSLAEAELTEVFDASVEDSEALAALDIEEDGMTEAAAAVDSDAEQSLEFEIPEAAEALAAELAELVDTGDEAEAGNEAGPEAIESGAEATEAESETADAAAESVEALVDQTEDVAAAIETASEADTEAVTAADESTLEGASADADSDGDELAEEFDWMVEGIEVEDQAEELIAEPSSASTDTAEEAAPELTVAELPEGDVREFAEDAEAVLSEDAGSELAPLDDLQLEEAETEIPSFAGLEEEESPALATEATATTAAAEEVVDLALESIEALDERVEQAADELATEVEDFEALLAEVTESESAERTDLGEDDTDQVIDEVAEADVLAADADLPDPGEPSLEAAALEAESEMPAPVRARMPADLHPEALLDTSDLDEELLDIFLQEGVEILDHSDSMMVDLRQAPEDREIIAGLQRELHTLKGGARMAGVAPIGDLSHAMESLFEALVEGRSNVPGRYTVEVLEHAFDSLHRMVQRVQQGKAIATPDQTIGVLEALERGEIPAFLSETAAPTVEAVPVEATPEEAEAGTNEEALLAAKPVPIQPPRPDRLRKTTLDEEEPQARMMQQEVIRVRADLLDNLVNFAGEVSIYRSRLEAQIGGFRFNLVEFDQTVTRLREQLRKLEMETEAQILSRYQREMEHLPGDPEFDPLELDRFSTLQQLSRALAESVSDLLSLQNLMDDIARQSETLLLQQSRVSSDLQEGLMRTRMVPFESLVPRLRRILRQTSSELGKRAQLRVEGAQGEMDRTVLERMTAPLEHMLRNALAHGLETPEHRRIIGKPEEGTIGIAVSREATEVVIKITDDGRGMDRDAIRNKAIERGLIRDDAQLSDRDLFQFVLETGFSTATEVSKIAGRGVGMDVVNSEIRQLGGSLQIDSERGRGTLFTVRLPFTLAVTQAILIKLADALFAVPMTSIQGVMRMSRKDFEQRQADQQTEVTYGGETYHIYDLGDLLGNPVSHTSDDGQIPLIMTRTGDQRGAIRVSSVVGSREIVVKSVGPQLSSVPGFFGATIMGDGSVVVILDLAPLVRHGAALRQAPELAAEIEAEMPLPVPVRKAPLVMVVDDSITMRKVTSRVLERHELDVVTAKDGLDAVEQLQDKIPDVMLLDIEMPRMDGYELATYMKNDPRLRRVPIIMITSRTGEKHRQRALEIGVERYLGKPYQENDLLQNVREALGQGATDGVH